MHSCSRMMARPFGNGLIHLPEKWEDHDNYLPSSVFPFKRGRANGSLQPPVHLPGMCAWKKKVMIKVMLLTIQIRTAGRVQTVKWASLRQWPFDLVRKLVCVFSSTHSKLQESQESQEWTVPHSCTLGYFLQTTLILGLISAHTHTHMAEIN